MTTRPSSGIKYLLGTTKFIVQRALSLFLRSKIKRQNKNKKTKTFTLQILQYILMNIVYTLHEPLLIGYRTYSHWMVANGYWPLSSLTSDCLPCVRRLVKSLHTKQIRFDSKYPFDVAWLECDFNFLQSEQSMITNHWLALEAHDLVALENVAT